MLVKNYIMMSNDESESLLPVLLDSYVAFDTVEYCVVFSRLKDMFDLSGKENTWMVSILSGTTLPESVCS